MQWRKLCGEAFQQCDAQCSFKQPYYLGILLSVALPYEFCHLPTTLIYCIFFTWLPVPIFCWPWFILCAHGHRKHCCEWLEWHSDWIKTDDFAHDDTTTVSRNNAESILSTKKMLNLYNFGSSVPFSYIQHLLKTKQ